MSIKNPSFGKYDNDPEDGREAADANGLPYTPPRKGVFGPGMFEDGGPDPGPVRRPPRDREQCRTCRFQGNRCPGLAIDGPEGCRYYSPVE